MSRCVSCHCFFFNDTATTEIYTLSLHDALPISRIVAATHEASWPGFSASATKTPVRPSPIRISRRRPASRNQSSSPMRSEEHTSELQSHSDLVCRLLLEKKKTQQT